MTPDPCQPQPPALLLKVEFYFGVKEIARFLGINETTCKRKLQAGKLPGKKDGMGRWVLNTLDYYQSLQG